MYLLTNTLTTISGIYRITLDRIAYDTGYDERTLRPMLENFKRCKKAVLFEDEYMILPSWPKHQKWEAKDTIRAGIEADLKNIPLKVKEYSLSIGYQYPIPNVQVPPELLYSDSDLHSDTDTEGDEDAEPKPSHLPPIGIGKDGISRFERAKETWNLIGFPTATRKTLLDLRDDVRHDINATFGHYTDDEIAAAMNTYAKLIADPAYDVFAQYKGLEGFMRGGVEKFVDEAKPREVYRVKTGEASKADVPRCKACTGSLLEEKHFNDKNDPRIGTCQNPECDMYHRRQE